MSLHYVLYNGQPVHEPDVIRWARWFASALHERIVAKTKLGDGSIQVSTMFLGVDHQLGRGRPILWETMVFGGPLDQEMDGYTSRENAVRGHAAMVERVRQACAEAIDDARNPRRDLPPEPAP
jgi:hypothetical protein